MCCAICASQEIAQLTVDISRSFCYVTLANVCSNAWNSTPTLISPHTIVHFTTSKTIQCKSHSQIDFSNEYNGVDQEIFHQLLSAEEISQEDFFNYVLKLPTFFENSEAQCHFERAFDSDSTEVFTFMHAFTIRSILAHTMKIENGNYLHVCRMGERVGDEFGCLENGFHSLCFSNPQTSPARPLTEWVGMCAAVGSCCSGVSL